MGSEFAPRLHLFIAVQWLYPFSGLSVFVYKIRNKPSCPENKEASEKLWGREFVEGQGFGVPGFFFLSRCLPKVA